MAFRVPTFNLTVNIWHYATWVAAFPPGPVPAPDVVTVGNLTPGRRVIGSGLTVSQLLLPARTDVRDGVHEQSSTPVKPDVAEIPAGTGRYYLVLDVEDVGRGFLNEYREATVAAEGAGVNPPITPPWPTPYP